MRRYWLFRTESSPSAEKQVELYTKQLKPQEDLRNDDALKSIECDSTLRSKTALAVAALMAKNMLEISTGDLLLVAYTRASYVDIIEVTEPYSYIEEEGKHVLKGTALRRIERATLREEIRNKTLRKPRIVAEIDDFSALLGNNQTEVKYTIPIRANYSVSFKVPADFTKSEANRLSDIFSKSWLIDDSNK